MPVSREAHLTEKTHRPGTRLSKKRSHAEGPYSPQNRGQLSLFRYRTLLIATSPDNVTDTIASMLRDAKMHYANIIENRDPAQLRLVRWKPLPESLKPPAGLAFLSRSFRTRGLSPTCFGSAEKSTHVQRTPLSLPMGRTRGVTSILRIPRTHARQFEATVPHAISLARLIE